MFWFGPRGWMPPPPPRYHWHRPHRGGCGCLTFLMVIPLLLFALMLLEGLQYLFC